MLNLRKCFSFILSQRLNKELCNEWVTTEKQQRNNKQFLKRRLTSFNGYYSSNTQKTGWPRCALHSHPVVTRRGSSWINGQNWCTMAPSVTPPSYKGIGGDWRCHGSELPGLIDFMQSSVNLCSHRVASSVAPEFLRSDFCIGISHIGREE